MAIYLAFAGALLAIGVAAVAIYEVVAIYRGGTTITSTVRGNIERHPHESVVIAAFFAMLAGWLIGHLGR